MVSNNAFQSGSFEFSKSKGIGLLRYCGVEELDWVLDRSPSSIIFENDSSNSYSAMNYEKFTNKYYDLYCFVDGLFTCSLHIFLKNFIDITLKIIPISLNVPYLNETIISSKCTEILQRVNYTNGVVPIEEIRDLLISEENLKFDETLSLPSGVLGKITFKPFKISILQNQIEARKRFTIAHEFGHYFLEHSKYMKSEKCRESSVNNDISIKIKDIIRLEWQANQFAACLLMPEKIFSKDFIEFGKERSFFNKGVAYLYVDSQPVNIESFNQITSFLKNKYKVSKFAVKYRLKQLGLITGPELKEKSLGDFLNP
jgi:Zn-dependent peptidase ImmA (M78 family)